MKTIMLILLIICNTALFGQNSMFNQGSILGENQTPLIQNTSQTVNPTIRTIEYTQPVQTFDYSNTNTNIGSGIITINGEPNVINYNMTNTVSPATREFNWQNFNRDTPAIIYPNGNAVRGEENFFLRNQNK